MTEYLWFLFSYLVGSIPNGYLIVKWVAGKDIRKIGREKLSGSNIIHNVGFLPGVVSGFFDIFKGILAVWGAYKLGFPENIQAIAGLFALCGQMWPIFLKFWGGRGGSVCIATILILSPKIFWPSALLWIFSKIFSKGMGAAIGMSLFFVTSIVLGFYLSVESVVIFGIPAFIFVLLQRLLGKPRSLSKIKDKKIILWRLLLDRDTKER